MDNKLNQQRLALQVNKYNALFACRQYGTCIKFAMVQTLISFCSYDLRRWEVLAELVKYTHKVLPNLSLNELNP